MISTNDGGFSKIDLESYAVGSLSGLHHLHDYNDRTAVLITLPLVKHPML
jgi:hypothetical protein